ncbi:hypothetical protein [Bacteroides reticulotermitis]|uniref:HicB family protein n=2 Tax=Bacteroides reticulotermitis TaxID=1133319 RepID=W4UQC3_9BACE|nr:hypothetical protein [Bacteroides reticulotermitis]MBB4042986.1 putative RNase H-like HicB family nuclease [Bacteroides reticulotermitis]GAE82987.1 hypothetical protein JCM10512_1231 [Bacteroides reticulotermitis JCM 10512]HJD75090.1 hypothetical protein [Bacteroides reticulotermitis]
MKLEKNDYVLAFAVDGRYYAWMVASMQYNASGNSKEEAVKNLEDVINTIISEMYMVEEFV